METTQKNKEIISLLISFTLRGWINWTSDDVENKLKSAPTTIYKLKNLLLKEEFSKLNKSYKEYERTKNSSIWFGTVNELIYKYEKINNERKTTSSIE